MILSRRGAPLFVQALELLIVTLVAAQLISIAVIFTLPPPPPEFYRSSEIVKALKTFKGRINQTALHANIPKKTLLRKIEKYGIVARDYADPK